MNGSARTPADRAGELAGRFAAGAAKRVASHLSPQLEEAHRDAPLGPHDDALARVLRHFRCLPTEGKQVIVATGVNGPWRIATMTRAGGPGNVLMDATEYDDYLDAMHAVFVERCRRAIGGHGS